MNALLGGCFLLVTIAAYGQGGTLWPCSDELTKSEGDNHRIRVSTGVSEVLIEKKVLPDVYDLKGTKTKSTVILRTLVDKSGAVRCAEPIQGDAALFQRSQDAVKQWHFKPFLLNGQALIIETPIEFVYKKDKVTAR